MKEYVTWEQVEDYVSVVCTNYAGASLTGVYGLPRGGLVLAVMISHRLGIPLLTAPSKNCLIVDDICDSGESLVHYSKNSSGDSVEDYYITTMYYKQNELQVSPDMWMYNKTDKWVVFPWEEKEV